MQTDASTLNIVGPLILGVVASVLAVVCKQMQQHSFQRCWHPQCILGRIQPIRLWRPCVMIVRGPSKLEEPCKWIQNCCPKCIEESRKNLEQVFICQIYLSNSRRSTIKNAFRSAYSFLFFILLCF